MPHKLRACEKIAKAVFLLAEFEETDHCTGATTYTSSLLFFREKKLKTLIYHIKSKELRGRRTQCGFSHHIMRERKPQ